MYQYGDVDSTREITGTEATGFLGYSVYIDSTGGNGRDHFGTRIF